MPSTRRAFWSPCFVSLQGFGGYGVAQTHRGSSLLSHPREGTPRCEPQAASLLGPFRPPGLRGPFRRQESQNTCPQLVRLKDDFLCGGWKQRLQNTQLAMTEDPRGIRARPARTLRYRRSPQYQAQLRKAALRLRSFQRMRTRPWLPAQTDTEPTPGEEARAESTESRKGLLGGGGKLGDVGRHSGFLGETGLW